MSGHLAGTCRRRRCGRIWHRWRSCSSWRIQPRSAPPHMLPTRTRVTRVSFPSVLGTTGPARARWRQTLTELALRSSPAGGAGALAAHTVTPAAVAVTHVYAVLSEASQRAGLTAAGAREAWQTLTSANEGHEKGEWVGVEEGIHRVVKVT